MTAGKSIKFPKKIINFQNRFKIYTKNEVARNETPQLILIQSDFRLQKFRNSYKTTYATEMKKILHI